MAACPHDAVVDVIEGDEDGGVPVVGRHEPAPIPFAEPAVLPSFFTGTSLVLAAIDLMPDVPALAGGQSPPQTGWAVAILRVDGGARLRQIGKLGCRFGCRRRRSADNVRCCHRRCFSSGHGPGVFLHRRGLHCVCVLSLRSGVPPKPLSLKSVVNGKILNGGLGVSGRRADVPASGLDPGVSGQLGDEYEVFPLTDQAGQVGVPEVVG